MDPNKPVREIMTTKLVTVAPDTSMEKVRTLFRKNNFHHLPVVDSGEVLAGIISREDFFRLAYVLSLNTSGKTYSEKEYQSLTAKDFMTRYPIFLDPEDTIGLAADIFLANKFHSLPILEDGRLVGLITTHDLLRFSFNSPLQEKEEEEYYEL